MCIRDRRTALALFLLFAVTVSAQAAKIAEVIPIGHTVGIKMQAEGVLIVQLTEVQGCLLYTSESRNG